MSMSLLQPNGAQPFSRPLAPLTVRALDPYGRAVEVTMSEPVAMRVVDGLLLAGGAALVAYAFGRGLSGR